MALTICPLLLDGLVLDPEEDAVLDAEEGAALDPEEGAVLDPEEGAVLAGVGSLKMRKFVRN